MDSYDFTNKHFYRRNREVAIDRMLSKPKAMRRVAYLDTREALDTIAYLKRGYRAENLWAINRNPAEVAHLSMKLDSMGLPRVNTVGLDFEDALDRKVPEVDIVDFDGMGCINPWLRMMLNNIVDSRPRAVYGVTVLAGRECGLEYKSIQHISSGFPEMVRTTFGHRVRANHAARLAWILESALSGREYSPIAEEAQSKVSSLTQKMFAILSACEADNRELTDEESREFDVADVEVDRILGRAPCVAHVTKIAWDVYVSTSGQPMLWCVCKLEPHRDMPAWEYDKWSRSVGRFYIPRCEPA